MSIIINTQEFFNIDLIIPDFIPCRGHQTRVHQTIPEENCNIQSCNTQNCRNSKRRCTNQTIAKQAVTSPKQEAIPKNIKIVVDNYETEPVLIQEVILCNKRKNMQYYNIFNTLHNRYILQQFINKKNHNSNIDITKNYKVKIHRPETKKALMKLLMMHHIEHHVFARLATTHHGVGIVAIKDIPEGTPIFDNIQTQCVNYDPLDITTQNVDKFKNKDPIIKLMDDFFLSQKEKVYPIPLLGPNSMDISFYLNHSKTPNLSITYPDECDMSVYIAKMDITVGSPLTIDYTTFGIDESVLTNRKSMAFLKAPPPAKTTP